MKIKKQVFLIGLSMAAIQIQAQEGGLYIGGEAGYSSMKLAVGDGNLVKNNLSGTGNVNDIYAGYQFFVSQHTLSIEYNFRFGTSDYSGDMFSPYGLQHFEVSREDYRSYSVIYGYQLKHAQPYLRIGQLTAEFTDNTDHSEDVDGVLLGIGVEFNLVGHISLRLDYQYVKYDDLKFDDTLVDTIKPKDYTFSTGLHYKF